MAKGLDVFCCYICYKCYICYAVSGAPVAGVADVATWMLVMAPLIPRPSGNGISPFQEDTDSSYKDDMQPSNQSEGKIAELLKPLPLFPLPSEARNLPRSILGPFEKLACSLASELQVPLEIAVQSVLSAASLAAQGIADVQTPLGTTCPLSLSAMSVIGPGARKTYVDKIVFAAIKLYEQNSCDAITRKIQLSDNSKSILDKKSITDAAIACVHTINGLSFEDFSKQLPLLPVSLLYVSSDALQFTNKTNKTTKSQPTKAGKIFDCAWSGDDIILNKGSSVHLLRGRRITISLTLDDKFAADIISSDNPGTRSFVSKTLIAWPESMVGKRSFGDIDINRINGLTEFNNKCISMLDLLPGPLQPDLNKIPLKVIKLSDDGNKRLLKFIDNLENDPKSKEYFVDIIDFTENATENICRIAGIFSLFKNEYTTVIDDDSLHLALCLFLHYAAELARIRNIRGVQDQITTAELLLKWLRKQTSVLKDANEPLGISTRKVLQYGPPPLRSKSNLDSAIKVLEDHGWIYMQFNRREIVLSEE
ncbi:MAG: DUF3987 domain-containing protein [Methylobacterium frigidaeris]